MVMLNGPVTCPPTLSVTLNVNLVTPAVVGVPVIEPLGFRARPAGNAFRLDPFEPVAAKVYGGVPPEAISVCEYGTLTVPFGSGEVVVMVIAGAMISVKVCDEPGSPWLSEMDALKLYVPAEVGKPLRLPELASKVRPGGRPLADQMGVPFAPTWDSVARYKEPTSPLGSMFGVVMPIATVIGIVLVADCEPEVA